jgi:hypothetical protein
MKTCKLPGTDEVLVAGMERPELPPREGEKKNETEKSTRLSDPTNG